MSEQQTQHKTGPKMRAGAEGGGYKQPPEVTVIEREPPKSPWHPIADAPHTGEYVYLEGDPNPNTEWYWYKTRHMNGGYWQPTGWWRQRFGASNIETTFKPTGFRLVKEGLPS